MHKTMLQLTDEKQNQIANNKENEAQLGFEARGFSVARLDKKNNGKRPDFLVVRKDQRVLVEIKTIISSGRTRKTNRQDAGWALSIYDNKSFSQSISFSDHDPIRKLRDLLGNAQTKFSELINDESAYLNVPYVVCIFDDSGFCPAQQILKDGFFDCGDISAALFPRRERKLQDYAERKSFLDWGFINNDRGRTPVDFNLFAPCIDLYPKNGRMPDNP